jgi:hypothetical protein
VSLSVCMISHAPAGRIAAVLEPVRALADEIVIAADARVDESTLAGYAGLADRVFRIEYQQSERHLAWLHAQCSGDWILRLDHDEVASRALADRLPELLASRDVQQYWFRRAWLFPDAAQVLDDPPWSVDFNNRLVRNDATLQLSALQHSGVHPLDPCEYVEEPLYHLELLVSDHASRRDKVVSYEVARPHMVAPGGGRMNEAFYLPELRESLRTVPVPDEDRATVQAVLDATGPVEPGPTGDVTFVPLAAMDWHREGRRIPETGYRAAIEPVGAPPVLAPGEGRQVLFRVTNQGSELWSWRPDADPSIRASYRWLHPDGAVHTPEGIRTRLSRAVKPGDRILVPLEVIAPRDPGRYVLHVDLVHEHVRWFDHPCRVEVDVRPRAPLPATALRLRETPPPRTRRLRRPRMRIPRLLHRVWLGAAAMPAAHVEFGRGFERHHPGWEMRLWTDADLAELDIPPELRVRARTPSELSNVVRFEVLARHGGVYVDTDTESIRPLDPLLGGVDAFAALELPGRAATGVIGGVPGHPAFVRAARLSRRTLGLGAHSADANGPYFISLILEQEPDVTLFGAHLFYPYHWEEPEKAGDAFPDAYAVHHWARSAWLLEGAG